MNVFVYQRRENEDKVEVFWDMEGWSTVTLNMMLSPEEILDIDEQVKYFREGEES